MPIDIPANATGTLSILVTDGTRLAQIEQRDVAVAAARRTTSRRWCGC